MSKSNKRSSILKKRQSIPGSLEDIADSPTQTFNKKKVDFSKSSVKVFDVFNPSTMFETSYEKSIENKNEKSLSVGEMKSQNDTLEMTMLLSEADRKALRQLNNNLELSVTFSASDIEKVKRKSSVFDDTVKLYEDPNTSMSMLQLKSNLQEIAQPSSPVKRSPRKTVFFHNDNMSVTVNDLIFNSPVKQPDENILFNKSNDTDMDITYFWPSEKLKNNDKENGQPKVLFKTDIRNHSDQRWRMTHHKPITENQANSKRESCHMSVDMDVDTNFQIKSALVHQITNMEIETEDLVKKKTRHEALRIRTDGLQNCQQTISQINDLEVSFSNCEMEECQAKSVDPKDGSIKKMDRTMYENNDLDISMTQNQIEKGRKSIYPHEDIAIIQENVNQKILSMKNCQTILPNDTPEQSFAMEECQAKSVDPKDGSIKKMDRTMYEKDDLDISMPHKQVEKGRKSIYPHEDIAIIQENVNQKINSVNNRQTILPNDTPEQSFAMEECQSKSVDPKDEIMIKMGQTMYQNDDLDISMPDKHVEKRRESIYPHEDIVIIQENVNQKILSMKNRQTILPNDTPEQSFSLEHKYNTISNTGKSCKSSFPNDNSLDISHIIEVSPHPHVANPEFMDISIAQQTRKSVIQPTSVTKVFVDHPIDLETSVPKSGLNIRKSQYEPKELSANVSPVQLQPLSSAFNDSDLALLNLMKSAVNKVPVIKTIDEFKDLKAEEKLEKTILGVQDLDISRGYDDVFGELDVSGTETPMNKIEIENNNRQTILAPQVQDMSAKSPNIDAQIQKSNRQTILAPQDLDMSVKTQINEIIIQRHNRDTLLAPQELDMSVINPYINAQIQKSNRQTILAPQELDMSVKTPTSEIEMQRHNRDILFVPQELDMSVKSPSMNAQIQTYNRQTILALQELDMSVTNPKSKIEMQWHNRDTLLVPQELDVSVKSPIMNAQIQKHYRQTILAPQELDMSVKSPSIDVQIQKYKRQTTLGPQELNMSAKSPNIDAQIQKSNRQTILAPQDLDMSVKTQINEIIMHRHNRDTLLAPQELDMLVKNPYINAQIHKSNRQTILAPKELDLSTPINETEMQRHNCDTLLAPQELDMSVKNPIMNAQIQKYNRQTILAPQELDMSVKSPNINAQIQKSYRQTIMTPQELDMSAKNPNINAQIKYNRQTVLAPQELDISVHKSIKAQIQKSNLQTILAPQELDMSVKSPMNITEPEMQNNNCQTILAPQELDMSVKSPNMNAQIQKSNRQTILTHQEMNQSPIIETERKQHKRQTMLTPQELNISPKSQNFNLQGEKQNRQTILVPQELNMSVENLNKNNMNMSACLNLSVNSRKKPLGPLGAYLQRVSHSGSLDKLNVSDQTMSVIGNMRQARRNIEKDPKNLKFDSKFELSSSEETNKNNDGSEGSDNMNLSANLNMSVNSKKKALGPLGAYLQRSSLNKLNVSDPMTMPVIRNIRHIQEKNEQDPENPMETKSIDAEMNINEKKSPETCNKKFLGPSPFKKIPNVTQNKTSFDNNDMELTLPDADTTVTRDQTDNDKCNLSMDITISPTAALEKSLFDFKRKSEISVATLAARNPENPRNEIFMQAIHSNVIKQKRQSIKKQEDDLNDSFTLNFETKKSKIRETDCVKIVVNNENVDNSEMDVSMREEDEQDDIHEVTKKKFERTIAMLSGIELLENDTSNPSLFDMSIGNSPTNPVSLKKDDTYCQKIINLTMNTSTESSCIVISDESKNSPTMPRISSIRRNVNATLSTTMADEIIFDIDEMAKQFKYPDFKKVEPDEGIDPLNLEQMLERYKLDFSWCDEMLERRKKTETETRKLLENIRNTQAKRNLLRQTLELPELPQHPLLSKLEELAQLEKLNPQEKYADYECIYPKAEDFVFLLKNKIVSENLNWIIDDMAEHLGIIFLTNKKLGFKVRIVFKKTACQTSHVIFSDVSIMENSIKSKSKCLKTQLTLSEFLKITDRSDLMKLTSSSKNIWRLLNYLDKNISVASVIVERLYDIKSKYDAIIFQLNSMIFLKKNYFILETLTVVELTVILNNLDELSEGDIQITGISEEICSCIPRNVKGLMFLESLIWNLDKALIVES